LRFGREPFTIRHVQKHFTRTLQRVALTAAAGVCLCGGASAVWAQSAAPAAKIGAIRISGQRKFSAEQVIAATGLKVGQAFSQKDLDAVAARLGNSGVFPTISYSYVPEGGLISIEFKVDEATKFRACVFDNFVWVSDDEIQTRLKKDVALYTGVAPETGDMLDQISGALEKLSQEKGVTVHVARRLEAAQIGDPNWSHLYSAEGPKVRIQSFRFTGASAVKPGDLEHEAEKFIGRDYSLFRCNLFGSSTIVPFYRERGYLRASLETPKVNILSRSVDSTDFAVEVSYAVTEGSAYKWGKPEWSGNQAIATNELDGLTGMKPGELANGKKIEDGWDAVRKAYSKSGYFESSLRPEPVMEEDSKAVHYRVTVTEGPQYRMGSFVVVGLPPAAVEKLKKKWRLKEGDVFDQTAASDFMKKDAISVLHGFLTPSSKVRLTTQPDRQRHVVNVTFQVQ
jgi:outer membrane protein insertion porin family